MRYMICKYGETLNGFTTVTLEKNGATVIFQKVPVLVCDNCGEKYIKSEITSELLKKAREIIKGGVKVDICEYQLDVA